MISAIVSRVVILLFGTLYPAYASYKAVRTKNVKEYVKWMMYWIVFALFTCAETVTDLFLSFWFPFYYELKIIIVIWLLSPATKGSSILYRNFVHPALTRREQEIDEYISKAKEQGYHTMLQLGSKGVNYATSVIMQTAIKGGGGIVNHLRRSYSLSDLSHESDLNSNNKTQDTVDSAETLRDLRMRAQRKPGGSHVDLYFPEMDVDFRSHPHELPPSLSQIRSTEDISSGYSSAEPLFAESQVIPEGGPLTRTASVGGTRGRTTRASRAPVQARKPITSEGEEGGLDFVFGWPHPLPPSALVSMLPELLNLDPSEAVFPPEYLQMILNNVAYSQRETQPNIYETNDEIEEEKRETAAPNQRLEDRAKEEISESLKITESKINESTEIVNEEKSPPPNPPVPKEETNPPLLIACEDKPSEIPSKESLKSLEDKIIENSSIANKEDTEQENKRISECFEDAAEEIDNNELKIAKKETLDDAIKNTSQSKIAESKIPENEIEQVNNRLSECFEDATDDFVLPEGTLKENNVNASPKVGQLQRSASKESVDSINEQCFEDSLPEIAIVARSESLSSSDGRKGKYHKGRAPPPPDGRKSAELYNPSENLSTLNAADVSTKSDFSARPSTPLEKTLQTENLNEDTYKPTKSGYEPQVKPSSKLPAPNIVQRETSPSPSLKSKKDGSSLSRFLPKSSMTSLFNIWGSKDSGKSSSPVVRPTSPSNFKSTVQYDPNPSSTKSDEKMLIRQMSHSPSRRKHGGFE